jgi:hypothetical protein
MSRDRRARPDVPAAEVPAEEEVGADRERVAVAQDVVVTGCRAGGDGNERAGERAEHSGETG